MIHLGAIAILETSSFLLGWYCHFPLSNADVRDLLSERGIDVDRSTLYR